MDPQSKSYLLCKPLRKKKKKICCVALCLPRIQMRTTGRTLFQKSCLPFNYYTAIREGSLGLQWQCFFSFSFTIFFFLSFLHFLSDPISCFVFWFSFFHSLNRQRPLKSKRTQARNGDSFKEHPIMDHAQLTHPFQGLSCRQQQIVVQL